MPKKGSMSKKHRELISAGMKKAWRRKTRKGGSWRLPRRGRARR